MCVRERERERERGTSNSGEQKQNTIVKLKFLSLTVIRGIRRERIKKKGRWGGGGWGRWKVGEEDEIYVDNWSKYNYNC